MSDEEKETRFDNGPEQESGNTESHSSYKLPDGNKTDSK